MGKDFLNNPDFMAIVNDVNEDFKNTEVISSWMPPDGEYTIALGEATGDRNDKDPNDVFIWLRLPVTIISTDEALNGKEFTLFYTSKFMSNLKRDSSVLARRTVDDLHDALKVMASAQGWACTIKVERGVSKKKNKPFVGTELLEIVDDTPGEASVD
jgi:hypothetical protein